MRGTPTGNREVMVPLHNLHWLVLVSLVGFSLGLRPMYLFVLGSTYFPCNLVNRFSYGHRGVPRICKELGFEL